MKCTRCGASRKRLHRCAVCGKQLCGCCTHKTESATRREASMSFWELFAAIPCRLPGENRRTSLTTLRQHGILEYRPEVTSRHNYDVRLPMIDQLNYPALWKPRIETIESHGKTYRVFDDTFYDADTPDEVIRELHRARKSGQRIRLHYGYTTQADADRAATWRGCRPRLAGRIRRGRNRRPEHGAGQDSASDC